MMCAMTPNMKNLVFSEVLRFDFHECVMITVFIEALAIYIVSFSLSKVIVRA